MGPHIRKISSFQKRCARLITGQFNPDVSSHTLIHSLNWLTVPERIKYFLYVFMYKSLNEMSPFYMQDCLTLMSDVHTYSTRNELVYQLPMVRTNYMKRSFKFQGPFMWNALPMAIKCSCSLNTFKSNVKEMLLATHSNM